MGQGGGDDGCWGQEEGLEGGVEGFWVDAVGRGAGWGWAVEDDDVKRPDCFDGGCVELECAVDSAQVGADSDASGMLVGSLLGEFCSASGIDDSAAFGGERVGGGGT